MISFRQYLEESEVVATKRQGLVHFDQMKPVEFIHLIQSLKSKSKGILKDIKVTGKFDGLGCLGYDTKIETLENGVMSLGKIVEEKNEFHIKSYDVESNEVVYKKITNFSEMNETDDWYEIELENGSKIIMTGNHRVFLPELKCWRRCDLLIEGDAVIYD